MKDTFAQAAQFAHACRNQKGGDHDVIIFVVVSARFIAEIPDVAREHVGIQSTVQIRPARAEGSAIVAV